MLHEPKQWAWADQVVTARAFQRTPGLRAHEAASGMSYDRLAQVSSAGLPPYEPRCTCTLCARPRSHHGTLTCKGFLRVPAAPASHTDLWCPGGPVDGEPELYIAPAWESAHMTSGWKRAYVFWLTHIKCPNVCATSVQLL